MPQFWAKMSSFTIDVAQFSVAFDTAVQTLFRQATAAFLRAALPKIPVRTGFVRGAFGILERFVGEKPPSTAASRLEKKIAQLHGAGKFEAKNLNFTKGQLEVGREELEKLRAGQQDQLTERLAKAKEKKLAALERQLKRQQKSFDKLLDRARVLAAKRKNPTIATQRQLHQRHVIALAEGEVDIERPQKFQPFVDKRGKEVSAEEVARRYRLKVARDIRGGKRAPLNPLGIVEYYKHDDGSRTIKTTNSGEAFASLDLRNEGGDWRLEFAIDISYFQINDANSNKRTPSAPWRSFADGQRAFNEVLIAGVKSLPDVMTFLAETEYTLDKSGMISKRTKRLAY